MKAMILAAGLGTRLKPLTDHTPKALLKIGNYTLLEFAIRKLIKYGFADLIVNVHHHADQIINYLEVNNNFGAKITISDETQQLLDTGGAINKASFFFNDGEPFLVYNADIVGNIDLAKLYSFHLESGNAATLVVRSRETQRYLLFDEFMQLTAWQNIITGAQKLVRVVDKPAKPFAFSGIHVINPELLPIKWPIEAFSVIDAYLELAKTHRIGGYVDESDLFADAGKVSSLEEAARISSLIKVV